MGNCQAAEAATVLIQHPSNNKVERIYWSVNARQVMSSNPGHFVALVLSSPILNGTPTKQVKLLRPHDTLLIGQVYRLISVQDVLKEFASKKCVKLGKLLKERGILDIVEKKIDVAASASYQIPNGGSSSFVKKEQQQQQRINRGGGNGNGNGSRREKERVVGRNHHQQQQQWRPALQSIAEIGT